MDDGCGCDYTDNKEINPAPVTPNDFGGNAVADLGMYRTWKARHKNASAALLIAIGIFIGYLLWEA